MSACHAGECPNSEKCSKKSKAYCPCRRIKKELRCDFMRSSEFSLPCDETCETQKSMKEKVNSSFRISFYFCCMCCSASSFPLQLHADELKKRRSKEEEEERIEAERFQKRIEGTSRRKNRGRNQHDVAETRSYASLYFIAATAVAVIFVAILYFQLS